MSGEDSLDIISQLQPDAATEKPRELIRYNPRGGYMGDALTTLRESGHPEFEEKVRDTAVDEPSSLTDEDMEVVADIIEPKGQLSGFMAAYATARWGGESASAVWAGEDRYHQENIAAKFWHRMPPVERNNFYLRMNREEAESFWNNNKLGEDESPVKIEVTEYQRPQQSGRSRT